MKKWENVWEKEPLSQIAGQRRRLWWGDIWMEPGWSGEMRHADTWGNGFLDRGKRRWRGATARAYWTCWKKDKSSVAGVRERNLEAGSHRLSQAKVRTWDCVPSMRKGSWVCNDLHFKGITVAVWRIDWLGMLEASVKAETSCRLLR